MIFNREFDKTLWLILNGEKYNISLICGFIELLPKQIWKQMDDAFIEYRKIMDNTNIDILDREDIKGEFYLNNTKYYFILDMILDCLIIGSEMLVKGEYQKLYELTLFSNYYYDKIQKGDNYYLGKMEEFITNKSVSYQLLNNFIGLMVVARENGCFPIYKKINVDIIQENINIKIRKCIK